MSQMEIRVPLSASLFEDAVRSDIHRQMLVESLTDLVGRDVYDLVMEEREKRGREDSAD